MDSLSLLLVLLFGLTFLAERWGRYQARRGARKTLEQSEALFSGTHEFVSVDPSRFDWLDQGYYDDTRFRLEAEGFRCLGDVEDLTLTEQHPNMRTFIRVMSGDRGQVTVGIYQVKLTGLMAVFQWIGLIPRRARVLELESELSDGRFLVTNNTKDVDTTPGPAAIEMEQHPLPTRRDTLLARHRERLRAAIAQGAEVVRVDSLNQAIAGQDRLQTLKNAVMQDREALVQTVRNSRGAKQAKDLMVREIRRA